jgi:hypothetical protein
MDTSADTAAWVAAIAAVVSLGIVFWQVFGARTERIRQHDIEILERMLGIISDIQTTSQAGWSPTLFMALYVTLSSQARGTQKTIRNIDANVPDIRAELRKDAARISTDLLAAIRSRVGLADDDWLESK